MDCSSAFGSIVDGIKNASIDETFDTVEKGLKVADHALSVADHALDVFEHGLRIGKDALRGRAPEKDHTFDYLVKLQEQNYKDALAQGQAFAKQAEAARSTTREMMDANHRIMLSRFYVPSGSRR